MPATILAPVLATWLDRVAVRTGLTLAYASTGAVAVILGLLLVAQAPVWAVVVAAVVQSALVALGRPAHYSALPRLAELPSHLVAANAVTGTAESLGVMLGPLTVALALTFSGSLRWLWCSVSCCAWVPFSWGPLGCRRMAWPTTSRRPRPRRSCVRPRTGFGRCVEFRVR